MSGVKGGGFPIGALLLPAALPLAALACGVAGGIVIARGVVRLSQKAYDSVSDMAEEAANKEMIAVLKRIEDSASMSDTVDIKGLYKTPSHETLLESATANEEKKVEQIEGIITFLNEERDAREKYEQKKRLRGDVSQEIEQEISKYKEEKRKQEEDLKKKAEKLNKIKSTAVEDEKQRHIAGLLNEIYNICNLIEGFYPDIVAKVREDLKKARIDPHNLRKIASHNHLEEKLKLIRDNSIIENLEKLLRIKLKYEANPFIDKYIENPLKKTFEETFKAKRQKAEMGGLSEKDIEELEAILKSHYEEAQSHDRNKRLKEAIGKIKNGLNKRGYDRIKEFSDKNHHKIEGKKKDGQIATISVLSSAVTDETQQLIKLKIDEKGYASEDKWNDEGRELAREIESLGVVIDLSEAMTHFNGKLVENSINILVKELKKRFPDKSFKVALINDSHIGINGTHVHWGANSSVSDVLVKYNSTVTEAPGVGTKDPVKETVKENT